MSEPTVADVEMHTRYLDAVSNGLSDNGYAFFAPPGRGMSHNRRTLQDEWACSGCLVLERQLTQQNGGLA